MGMAILGHGVDLVVVAAPHVCNYVYTLIRLNAETPLCIYLRWSNDPAKRRLKERWCRAAGLDVFVEPASAPDPSSRAASLVELVRSGKAVVMTPDIAQKSKDGVAVRLFGRRAYLPSGPASIAMLAEAPIVPVFGRIEGERHTITIGSAIRVERLSRAEGGRRATLKRATQSWADQFEAFVRDQPHAWFLWADSRWTRVFRGDSDYCGSPQEPPAEAGGANADSTTANPTPSLSQPGLDS